jgi:heat shock protein HtpX
METRAYGRDRGLQGRMYLTIFLLGLLYVVFFAVMISLFKVNLIFAVALLGGLAFFQYFTSDRIALAASRAKVVTPEQAPELHAMVERLSEQAGVPKPKVAIIPTAVPNAFATGRSPKHSAVAVTQGLMDRLTPAEVEGVLAHELSHVRSRDVTTMTIAGFFSMLASYLTQMALFSSMFGGGRRDSNGTPVYLIVIVVSIVTYILSYVLILSLSRYREFAADRGSARITGAPEHLMSALRKIASDMTRIPQRDLREMKGMNAFYIIPTNMKSSFGQLFLTHPPLEKRLARLGAIAEEMGRPQPM